MAMKNIGVQIRVHELSTITKHPVKRQSWHVRRVTTFN
jgi:hypothetical protein